MQDANAGSEEVELPNAGEPSPAAREENLAPNGTTSETVQPDLEQEIMRLRDSSNEFKDKYLRGLAETENLRKRLQKERQELVQYAIQNVIIDFLLPLDHFENALKFTDQASQEVRHWATGFQMILNQFKDVLATNGVTPYVSVGQPYDHALHEAVEMVETSDFPEGTVVEESLRGYKINGERILRPARVKVAKAVANDEEIVEISPNENT